MPIDKIQQEEMNERFKKKFSSLYGINVSVLNSEPVMIGNPPIADLLSFIQSEVSLAVANREEEITAMIVKEVDMTDQQLQDILSLILKNK